MNRFSRAAVFAAGFAVASAAGMPVWAADLSPSLQSFGTAKAISAYELSSAGVAGVALQPTVIASLSGSANQLATAAYGAPLSLYSPAFATSTVLSPTLALDGASGADIAARFNNYSGTQSPFLSAVNAPFLTLANGGHYAGLTLLPVSNLRVRLGVSLNSERLDQFAFDPISAAPGPALTYDPSQTKSLLAGLSWDISDAVGVDFSAISSARNGVPLGFTDAASIAPKASTNAIGVSAHLGLGAGWVTTAAFSEGLSQLDLRGGGASTVHEQSYSIAIAKHGLFGDDALGLSLSRPAPSMAGSFSSLIGSGDMPATVIGQGQGLNGQGLNGQGLNSRTPETDFQLGYVTNFLDGAVALQTNAAYQVNFQGQTGTNAVSLLSRAKIKF